MYQIKRLPEDFIVKEISSVNVEQSGQYAYFLMRKTNFSTVNALQAMSKRLGIPLKSFGLPATRIKMR